MKPIKDSHLDRVDREILRVLQRQGRISNVELAKHVNLSPSPCLERTRRLENEGYISSYVARLNAQKLDFGLSAYIEVTLDRSKSTVFDTFKHAVVGLDEVVECDMVAGGFDYLVKLKVADMPAYRVVLSQLVDLPGVAQTHTYMVIEHVKEDCGLAL